MSKHTFVGELLRGEFKDAWNDFKSFLGADKNLEQALEEGWDNLSQELKDALVNGSGIMKTIADNINAAPPEIVDLIKKIVPNFDEAKITTALQNVEADLAGVSSVVVADLPTTIANIQLLLKQKEQTKLGKFLSQAAQTIASILSPDSPFGHVVQWIEMAFRVFVKK